MTIETHILQKIQAKVGAAPHLYLAFSGGLDSTVLLHVLAKSELKARITAIHIHHGLSKNADLWLAHCKAQCEALSVPFECQRVVVATKGKGIEAEARAKRQMVFESCLSPGDVVLTAHHLNDQVETFFYRLVRGAGLQGLSSMSEARPIGCGRLIRPMLLLSRSQLEAYAQKHKLAWVEDESNREDRFDRNFLRNQVLPLINSRWGKSERAISRSIENIQHSKYLLDEYLDQDLASLGRRVEKVGESVCLGALMECSPLRMSALLRRWCERLDIFAPEKKQMLELDNLLHAKQDAKPCLRWGASQFRRFGGRLYLLPNLEEPVTRELVWGGETSISLGAGFQLNLEHEAQCQAGATYSFRIGFEKKGVRCKPLGRSHSQTLKKLFQEYNVEPWLRPHVPLVYLGQELIAVGDYWLCETDKTPIKASFEWSYLSE